MIRWCKTNQLDGKDALYSTHLSYEGAHHNYWLSSSRTETIDYYWWYKFSGGLLEVGILPSTFSTWSDSGPQCLSPSCHLLFACEKASHSFALFTVYIYTHTLLGLLSQLLARPDETLHFGNWIQFLCTTLAFLSFRVFELWHSVLILSIILFQTEIKLLKFKPLFLVNWDKFSRWKTLENF